MSDLTFSSRRARGPAELATLMYHEVTDDPATSGFQRRSALPYKHSRTAFAAHLDRIAAGPHLPELVTDFDLTRPGRHVLLTFDDGGASAPYIGDVLAARNWRGHFFVVTGLIGKRGFASASDIRYLRDAGHLVGSHSHTHPDIFREQSAAQMLEEWRVSRASLEDLLGAPCRAASVPGGDISSLVLRTAAQAGLEFLFTSEPWLTPRRVGDCWVVGRCSAKVETSPDHVGALTQFRGWTRALVVRRLKVAARYSASPLYRRYVDRVTAEQEGD
jgi:peptidoglycan/xylan/chitin deacetylase (PgdA/CDA1 family)